MPLKQALSSPVYEMPHGRQVELLSEALLREYMHRRKFSETLRAFDAENPRDGDTISSRALMSDLMALGAETQRAMRSEGVETIMEMLCFLRVRRRLELEELKRRASAEIPATPEKLRKGTKEKRRSSTKSISEGTLSGGPSKRRGAVERRKCAGSSDSNENNSNSNSDSSEDKPTGGRGLSRSTEENVRPFLGKKLTRSVIKLLCGTKTFPSTLLEQGFLFDSEVEYGLIQGQEGLGAIFAVVQAFLCTFFFKGGFIDVQRHQRQCLLRAVARLISMAQPNPRLVCLVNGYVHSDSVELDLTRLGVWRDFSSMKDVEEALDSLLEDWMLPKGSGVLCFLFSMLLSRGLAEAASFTGDATTSFIDDENRCSSDLARLLLRGNPARESVDGLLGDLMLGASSGGGGMGCGYISSGPDGATLDAHGAKNPQHPVWVLHHDGRFAVLFLKRDSRRQFEQRMAVGMPASSDLFFYDPAAPEKGEKFFTVSTGSSLSPRQQNGKQRPFLHDALCAIPVWRDAEIDWNGPTPTF